MRAQGNRSKNQEVRSKNEEEDNEQLGAILTTDSRPFLLLTIVSWPFLLLASDNRQRALPASCF
jgi:hypothetical protein